ncbi:YqeG family HAD IIIA-type phosphatase [Acholeplasma hippikon]|uniref:Pyrophosphatase PpaX n=1 Tax=Acholeplasma hippikon TaxID=264636 RepID=A0A449BJI9_9MOLU|nr:YqeG family HAD IIIA-type phosphatase [Acholeplasma hippikon]VEU82590.1 pyrophosphatase PpaX [Acholeplasma hippikon]
MAIYKKCIPNLYVKSIYDISYDELKKQGIKALLFDLDNTIINYDQTKLEVKAIEFLNELENDFKVVIISNSRNERVLNAVGSHFTFVSFARKPLKVGFKKALKKINFSSNEVAMIGDQLMTDVFGGNRMKFKTILVEAVLRKSDRLSTRINRKLEKYFLNRIKVKSPKEYDEVLRAYAEKHE